MSKYQEYRYFRAGLRDWQVWSYSTLTGDRKDWICSFMTKQGAAAWCRKRNDEMAASPDRAF